MVRKPARDFGLIVRIVIASGHLVMHRLFEIQSSCYAGVFSDLVAVVGFARNPIPQIEGILGNPITFLYVTH